MANLRDRLKSRARSARKLVGKKRQKTKRPKSVPASPSTRRTTSHPPLRELCLVRAPAVPIHPTGMGHQIQVATYNVHRWTGLNGRSEPDPARACFVISELPADVIALQEVLRPFKGDDPLERLADVLGLHLAFAATRVHRHGELGNAILSRWPILSVSTLDLSHSRLERRVAVAARFDGEGGSLGVIATHLALVDRTRHRQVRELLEHPQLLSGPAILLGDMNAWRRCKATRALDDALKGHGDLEWPASFPAAAPVLALDRVYARGARIVELRVHSTVAARRASDHLPVLAQVELPAA
jgi:endonuclease/exonuclease/phosphatase family metal-dependent hydrolase